MDQEIWQQLRSLESNEIIKKWFYSIHHREVNNRRVIEISSATKQAREFFRNASLSDYSVRPLLTYYGVTSLGKALLLLLKKSGGEESLSSGHGLITDNWMNFLSGDLELSMNNILLLPIKTSKGFFTDFLHSTNNRICLHVNSSNVDWWLNYEIPPLGNSITFDDLLSRIPDLQKDYSIISENIKYSTISDISADKEKGFHAKTPEKNFDEFKKSYEKMGYEITKENNSYQIRCSVEVLNNYKPQFINSYIQKLFGAIPNIFIVEPFINNTFYSQLCITIMLSYFLGMLVRYFPTHWISLVQGSKNDILWPTINRAQHYVEISFPILVTEMIQDILKTNE